MVRVSTHTSTIPVTMTAANATTIEAEVGASQVSSERYPTTQPLATILRKVVQVDTSQSTSNNENIEVVRESVEDALRNVFRNCFVAMDEMYFST